MADAVGAEDPLFNDSMWTDINLPHSFSIPYFMDTKVYSGYGWYRKTIEVPAAWMSKNITLEFEAAFIETEVYVNGNYVGKHIGGYTGFYFEISSYLKEGKNTIAIRVNNLWKPDVAPRTGDHQFSGGIYRDVYLNITDPLHVEVYGTCVRTPQVSETSATCEVFTEIANRYEKDKKVKIKTEIRSPQGKVVAKSQSSAFIKSMDIATIKHSFPSIKSPELWSPEQPRLYKAITSITMDGKEIDAYETTFGIRSFEWTADKGFFLNGKHYYLRGANVHQDQAGWGDAVTNKAMRRDVQMMKDAGFNCIRGSHYPHDPAFVQACDEIGMIFFSENAFWAMGGGSGDSFSYSLPPSSGYPTNPAYQDNFDLNVLTQLKEMITIHRNHASVAAWSLCNEPFFTDASTDVRMKRLLNLCTDSARIWDPTREVAIGGCQRKGIDRLGKGAIAFYNGGGEAFYKPGVPNLVSEYGSTVSERPGRFIPGWANIAEKVFEGGGDPWNPPAWRSGHIIWCGFDHGTIGGRRLATMGLVDYFRLPKRSYYWYLEAYQKNHHNPIEPEWPQSGIPARLRITPSDTRIWATDGTDDIQCVITVLDAENQPINNNVPIDLTILSGPGEFPTGRTIRFTPPSPDNEASDIQIRDGMAAISFRSYHGGRTLICASSPGLQADTVEVITLGNPHWEEDITRPCADRPYQRYTEAMQQQVLKSEALLLALNRPTWASSVKTNSSSSNANDNDDSSCWEASPDDTIPWWKVHLEAAYSLNTVQIVLPEEKQTYSYKIEVSSDDIHWKEIAHENPRMNQSRIRTYRGDFGEDIAFVRICFTSPKAVLTEVRIGGK